jgi:hypothetical protein
VSKWKRTLVLPVAVTFNNCHDGHEVNISKGSVRFGLVKVQFTMGDVYRMEVSKF